LIEGEQLQWLAPSGSACFARNQCQILAHNNLQPTPVLSPAVCTCSQVVAFTASTCSYPGIFSIARFLDRTFPSLCTCAPVQLCACALAAVDGFSEKDAKDAGIAFRECEPIFLLHQYLRQISTD